MVVEPQDIVILEVTVVEVAVAVAVATIVVEQLLPELMD